MTQLKIKSTSYILKISDDFRCEFIQFTPVRVKDRHKTALNPCFAEYR